MPFAGSPIFTLPDCPEGGSTEWTRPTHWLPHGVTAGQQKIAILAAISTDMSSDVNRIIAFQVSGAYTVDWGDGSALENFNTNVVARHTFDPATLPTALEAGAKQALITITPQAGNLATFATQSQVASKNVRLPVLEIVVGPSTITTFTVNSAFDQFIQHIVFLSELTLASLSTSGLSELRSFEGSIRWGTSTAPVFTNNTKQTKFPMFTFTGTTTTFTNMFNGCASMVTPPTLNMANATSCGGLFSGCRSMRQMPAWVNTSKCVSTYDMFKGCYLLESATLDLTVSTNAYQMFQDCFSIREVTLTGAFHASALNLSNLFNGCSMLERVNGTLNAGNATNVSNLFTNANKLRWVTFAANGGPKLTFALVGLLDAATLNAVYTSLPTVTGQTITVTNLPGTVGDDPTIATAKGWTVTGS